MNARLPRRIVVVLLIAGMGVVHSARAHETKDRVVIEWKRDPKVAIHRVEASPPAAPYLPPELAIAPPAAAPRVEPSRAGRTPAPGQDIDGLAMRAGDEMAQEAARVWAWREYWRAGFARGVPGALDDPDLGAWDHEEGMRFGRSDPRIPDLGEHLANEAAEGPADNEAEARVRRQFMDLDRQPARDGPNVRGAKGPSPRGSVPSFAGPWTNAPVLEDVFTSVPLGKTPGLSRDGRRAIENWRVEPATLAHRDRATGAYDARWKDPDFAFSSWRERQHRGSPWSRWTGAERERFRVVFCNRFRDTLLSIDLRVTRDAWRAGFAEGWRYGAMIQAEWGYRQGYAEGFNLGVAQTATITFPYAYDRAYTAAYDRWFDEWSRNAHPGVGEVTLADETDDGIFEPGERVHVAVGVVNYGGGAGTFDLIASGNDLGLPATTSVSFAGRGRVREPEQLTLRVGDRVPPRTRTAVTVALADARADAPLYVSRPLEIEGSPAIDADRLGGRATLAFTVTNTSRRDARAVVRAESLTGARDPHEDDLGLLAAGGQRQVTVTFDAIHPLDLIGGTSRWRASVARGDTIDDVREVRIAPVAADLSNPDLMDFMLALAATPQVSRSDVEDSRALMMERLRADWERAADASGNPYKRDFESGGTETVLGELVRATQGGRKSFASPQVFDGLDGDIERLSDDLPGAHPLLRKWMKKLAKRVG